MRQANVRKCPPLRHLAHFLLTVGVYTNCIRQIKGAFHQPTRYVLPMTCIARPALHSLLSLIPLLFSLHLHAADQSRPTLYYIPHTHWEGAVFKTREEYLNMGLINILKA